MLEKRAYADILLVEGNPHDVVKLLADPEKKKLKLIMTDGKIYKNTLE
jgi:imidazolonepropionase-like amidohydrolase